MTMDDKIPKRTKSLTSKLVKPIIPLTRPDEDELQASEYIDHTCHNIPGNIVSEKYVIKISIFDSSAPEEWIIFMYLVQKSLVGQNITSGPTML